MSLSVDTASIIFCMIPLAVVLVAIFWQSIWPDRKALFVLGALAGCSGIYQIWSRIMMPYVPFYGQIFISLVSMILAIFFCARQASKKQPKG
jgi:hypothetical protein